MSAKGQKPAPKLAGCERNCPGCTCGALAEKLK